MFQGLVKCSSCGASLARSAGDSLQCTAYSKGICTDSHYIGTDKLKKLLFENIQRDLESGPLNITQAFIPNPDNNVIEKQIEREQSKLSRIKQAYEQGIDTIEEYKASKERILLTISNLTSKMIPRKTKTQKELEAEWRKKNKNVLKILKDETIDLTEKNKLMRTFIEKIIFEKLSNQLRLYYRR